MSYLTGDNSVLGDQRPRLLQVPEYVSTAGQEAVELAAMAGLELDPWQRFVLSHSLGEKRDGSWAAFEVGLCVARQNGKSELLVARMLAGLFVLGEELIIFSAHQFDTSLEIFRRLVGIIENTPELVSQVKLNRGKVGTYSHGAEGVELRNGQRVRFKARSSGGGRGFSADCLILDEAMILKESMIGNVLPTLSARRNPQVWYAGSAVDQAVHEDGIVFARLRERGIAHDESVAWFEWSVDRDEYMAKPNHGNDPRAWGQANPGMGIRISPEYIANERRSMAEPTFMTERLGIGDWPRTDGHANRPIAPEDWLDCLDRGGKMVGPVVLAFDVTPDRSHTALAAAGASGSRSAGISVVDVINHARGTNWLAERLRTLCQKHQVTAIVCDASGPAGSLLSDLQDLHTEIVPVSAREQAHACGVLFDAVTDRTMRHGGTPELMAAMDGAATRPLSDAWAWSRKSSSVDISPLVAVTLALWGHQQYGEVKQPGIINLSDYAGERKSQPEPSQGVGPFSNRVVPLSLRW